MGWFGNDSDNSGYQQDCYNQVQNYNPSTSPSIGQEVLAGAASYEAAKLYENHVAQNGTPPSHEKAKELIAGFAGAFADRKIQEHNLSYDSSQIQDQACDHTSDYLQNNWDSGNQTSW